jgi:hypothetical protein
MTTKAVWGPCVWYLFHTLAHHIDETSPKFESVKNEFISFSFRIATNLPCPECSQHATTYLSKVNPKLIKTKNDLKMLYLNFHNAVNIRKGKPVFSLQDADSKYEKANVKLIIEYFFQIYGKKTVNVKLMINNFHKDILLSEFKAWTVHNIQMFI